MLENVERLIADVKDRKSFLAKIGLFLPRMDPRFQSIERAYREAEDAFRDVYRDGGDRYFEHLSATTIILVEYLRIRDWRLIVAELLHDIVEDIPDWTIERVRLAFGDEVAFHVDWGTKPSLKDFPSKKARDMAYYSRFPHAPKEFFILRFPDRLHNHLTMWGVYDPAKIARKIEETRIYYLPYAEKHLILLHELEEALQRLEAQINTPQSQMHLL